MDAEGTETENVLKRAGAAGGRCCSDGYLRVKDRFPELTPAFFLSPINTYEVPPSGSSEGSGTIFLGVFFFQYFPLPITKANIPC